MKKLNPFNWASSMLIAKFLSPYFKNIDENNVNIGFWKGDITLTKLELRHDFLILGDITLDVEGSLISEIKIHIPWSNITNEPINIEIKGVKLCVSQEMTPNKNLNQKEDMLNELKKEALKNFDQLIKNQAKDEEVETGGGYFTNLINSIGQKITLKIEDVEVMYIFHISNKEIVKFGINVALLEIGPCPKSTFDNSASKEIHIRKLMKLEKLSVYFDVYDDSFLTKYQQRASESQAEEFGNLHQYILNDTNLDIDIEVRVGNTIELKPIVKISPILLHFNQKQIKYLLLCIDKFVELGSTRPKVRPVDKKSVTIWWKYAVKRVMETENIQNKIFSMSFNTYVNAEKYKVLYLKKCINPNIITISESKFMEKFETENSLAHTIQIRNIALAQIKLMNFKVRKGDKDERKNAEIWFKRFNRDFSLVQIMEINLEKKKMDELVLSIRLLVNVESINLLIRENNIIDSLKNLQHHVNFFKSTLNKKEQLRNKVIEHIKKNFIKALNNEVNKGWSDTSKLPQRESQIAKKVSTGNYNSTLSLKDYLDYVKSLGDNPGNHHKFLLCLSVEGIAADCRIEKTDIVASLEIKRIVGANLLGINKQIKYFLEVNSGLKIYYSTRIIKLMNLKGIKDSESSQQLNLVHLDVEVPRINVTLNKPFIERLGSLHEFLTFDQDTEKWKTTFNADKNQLLYDTILRKRENIKQQMNLSVTIQKINVFLPTDYMKPSYMLVLHVDQLKLYKREHENNNEKNVIAIANAENENEIFNQDFQPLLITVQNLRGLITDSFQWETIENPFLKHNVKNRHKKAYISTLFEILHIHFSIEKYTQMYLLANGQEVYPSQNNVVIKLPLLILNLSVKNMYILMNLVELWTGQTAQINLHQIKKSTNQEGDESENPLLSRDASLESPEKKSSFHKKDRNLAKTKIVDHNLIYELNIRKILDMLVLSEVDFICEGVVVNLNLEDDYYFDQERRKFHKHSLMSVYLHAVKLKMISKYFESRFSIALQQFLIEYHVDCTERQVSQIAKGIYDEMVLEDGREDQILVEEEGHQFDPSVPKSSVKQEAESSFFSRNQDMCPTCFGNKSNLVLNFVNHNIEEQPDVLVHVSIIDDEFQRIVDKDYIQTEVGILLADLTVSANPEAFKQIKIILDYAQLYAAMRYRKFVKFMKEEAFWPEVRIDGQVDVNNLMENSIKEDKGIAITQIKLHVPSVNAIFLHENEPIYLLNLQDISMEFNIYLRDSDLKLNARDLVFYNTSKIAGPHNQILSVLKQTDDSYALSVQMKSFGKYQSAVKNFSSWLGIKLSGVKVVFLKRVVMEFVEYLLKNLVESFSPQVQELRDIGENMEEQRSELKLELVVLDSIVELFRNSIDSDCLILQLQQVGLWSCGKWGDYEGYLIEHGKFEDDEMNEFSSVNNTKEFHDARGVNEEFTEDFGSPNSFDDFGSPKKNYQNTTPSDDIFKIRVLGVEIKTQEGAEDAIFVRLAKESILLDLILEDKTYPIAPGEDFPLKILIMISSLKMFAYEPDFTLLMKMLQENLGESPQVVVSKEPPPSPTNKAASIVVDVQVQEGLIKVFNGSRADLRKKFKREVFERDDYLKDFIYKNPNSLALLTIERVHVKFTMMVSGDKVMTLNIKQMDMYDIRQKSKITKECRKILSSLIAKFKFDEETTSYIELDHFDPEVYEDFDIDLGQTSQASEQNILNHEANQTMLEPKRSLKPTGVGLQAKTKTKSDDLPVYVEEDKPFREKASSFFRRIFCCMRRKPKEQIQMDHIEDAKKHKVDLIIDHEENLNIIKSPPNIKIEKKESLLFNPGEDPNAFVIEKEKDYQQFLSQSDKVIIDALDKDFKLNDSAGAAEEKKASRIYSKKESFLPTDRGETSFKDFPKSQKFIISHESEIKPSNLKDVDYGEWAADSEIFLYFEADSEGEKNILISLNNKSIVVAKDFLIALTNFFKKPFTDTVDPSYVRQMVFNNFPPMKVKISLNSLALVFLSKFDTLEDNQALTLITSVIFTQESYGDAGVGPGRTQMGVEVLLKRLLFVNSKDIFVKSQVPIPLAKLDEYQNFFSLIETFKIYFTQTYSLPYYLKHRATPATSELRVEIKNNKRLVHNFVLSTDHLNLLQKVAENVMSSTLDSKEEVVFAQSNVPSPFPQPEIISTYLIKVNRIRINVIKMVQGMELLHIQFSKIILKSIQEKDQILMKCKMILDIEYFNRPKIAFEPLLEPWEFMIKFDKKDRENVIELCNVEPSFDPTLDLRQQHLNKNALNLNVSTSAIGAILELLKLITGKMEEADPYKIKNYTGFSVSLVNSSMTDAKTSTSINLDDKQTKDLDWRFFRKPKRKYKYVSDVNAKSFLDMEIKGRKKKIPLLSTNTLHDLETGSNAVHEFTTSHYKKIKEIDCDLIGKRFYKLKSEISAEATSLTKKQGRHFDFPFFSSKKAAEMTSTFLICSVHINPLTATKEVVLRSTAILKNYLNVALKVKFNYKSRITKTDESIEEMIEPQGKYYLPIEVIEEKTLIYFGTDGFEYSDKFNLRETIQNKDFMNENEEEEEDMDVENLAKDPTLETEKRRKYKKDHLILCKSDNENKSFNFVLTVTKKKVLPALPAFQNTANKEDFCFETVLLVNPLISITNATVKPIRFTFLKESSPGIPLLSLPPLPPGNFAQMTELGYEEDLLIHFNLEHYEATKARRVFKKTVRDRYCAMFKPIDAKEIKTKCKLYLWVEITKKSNQSRNIVIFCPYLIINETYQNLRYQERVFGFGKPSEDPTFLAMESLKSKSLKSGMRSQDPNAVAAHSEFRITDNLKSQVDEEGEEDIYEKIHMFSTSRRMNKLQISLRDTKNWSKPFSLQSASGSVHLIESLKDSKERDKDKNSGFRLLGRVSNTWNNVAKYLKKKPQKEQLNKRKKYEFGVRTEVAPGIFHRSRLIILTPRFAIKNESGQNLMLAQSENIILDESIMRLKHNAWGFFHWADSKKPNNVVMSLSDSLLQKPYAWSGRFKIDQVGDFTVKLKQDKKESLRIWNNEDYYYARIVITLDGSIVVIRILPEDLNNPPYKIQNNTLYDISYRQKPLNNKDKKLYNENAPYYKLAPEKTISFSWDEMIGEKILEIEIESVSAEYNLDTIKDYEPIPLGKVPEASTTRNGKFFLKKGYLGRKKPYDEEYEEEYCVLSIGKQRLKLYNKKHPNIKEKIPLKGAKIEDMKDVRFILNVEVNKKPKFIEFKAKNEDDAIEWVEFIKRAAFVHGPNIVYVKIDPVNSTKVIKFHMIKENKKSDEDEWLQLEEKKKNRYTSTIYKLAITNMIGISLIDSYPREIIHITITNLNFTQTILNEAVQRGESDGFFIDEMQESSQWERQNMLFTIDSITINNQLHETQFPVMLARNKKNTKNLPLLFLTYYSKNMTNTKINSTLNYIFEFKGFLDTLEVRLDDYLVFALLSMFSQIPFLDDTELYQRAVKIYDPTPLQTKLDDKIIQFVADNKRVYIKLLRLEPVDLTFTFRNSPGQKFNQTASNFFADFGLSLVTLDSAKIRLNHLLGTHIFGSTSEIVGRITKHYSRQLWTQLYKLFGSIEILGNPISLIENLGIGVVELFYEPLHALVTGNQGNRGLRFGQSLAYGVKSFFQHALFGIAEALTKILRGITNGLAAMTADKQYLQLRQRQKNTRIRTIKEGVLFGSKNFLHVLWDTLSGIVTKPYIEYKKRGFLGIFRGIYTGLISIILKPLVGLYDLIASLVYGIKNSAKYEEHIMDTRTRPPRLFGENQLIVKYDWGAANAQDVIRRLKYTKSYDHEKILVYDEIKVIKFSKFRSNPNYQVILTDVRFLYAKMYNNLNYTEVKLYKIKNVKYNKEKNCLEIYLLVPVKKHKYKLSFPYESYEKAKVLLNEFAKQGFLAESQIIE